MTVLSKITATAAQGRRIMPIREPEPAELLSGSRRQSVRLLGFRDARSRLTRQGRRATIGTGNGQAARRQVVRWDDRITTAPGPGCAGDAEPMARRAQTWIKACDCAFC
ncbi:MAG: hypothetical protein ABWZ98_08695 [Nakamurella sp.]